MNQNGGEEDQDEEVVKEEHGEEEETEEQQQQDQEGETKRDEGFGGVAELRVLQMCGSRKSARRPPGTLKRGKMPSAVW